MPVVVKKDGEVLYEGDDLFDAMRVSLSYCLKCTDCLVIDILRELSGTTRDNPYIETQKPSSITTPVIKEV